TGNKRVSTEPVRSVDRIIAFAGSKQAGNICSLLKIHPKSAHRIMYTGENPHRHISRVVANKHLVYLENCSEPLGQNISGNVRQVEVNLVFSADTMTFDADLENLAGGYIARHEVAIGRIFFFEKIPPLGIGNIAGRAGILRISGHPDAAAFTSGGFAH